MLHDTFCKMMMHANSGSCHLSCVLCVYSEQQLLMPLVCVCGSVWTRWLLSCRDSRLLRAADSRVVYWVDLIVPVW